MSKNVIFVFNVLRPYYNSYGQKHYSQIREFLNSSGMNSELLSIINQEQNSIEQRAQQIERSLPLLLKKMNIQKAHIVTNSLSGLDLRYYISQLKGHAHIESLSTIATPHRGSFLSDSFNQKKIHEDIIEPISRFLGVDQGSFREINTQNITSFNETILNHPEVKYYSLGGQKLNAKTSNIFRVSNNFISTNKEQGWNSDNDGVFAVDEVKWGDHLINFEADHADLVGLGSKYDSQPVFQLIAENILNQN